MEQFLHIEMYSETKTDRKSDAESIVKEAVRDFGYCFHVESPQKPRIVYGSDPRAALYVARINSQNIKDKSGKKMRKDAPILIAGVISYPAIEMPEDFLQDAIDWLREDPHFGDRLVSVVLHEDESYAHLHFYVAPEEGVRIQYYHPALHHLRFIEEKLDKQAYNDEYKRCMSRWQDSFYESVSKKHGLDRISDEPKARVTREEWKVQRESCTAGPSL